jgi:hypothetical protein
MSKTKQPTPSLDAYKIKIESLKLPSDGRAWKHAAAQRKTLLMHFISFGDRHGNHIFPGIGLLMERTGWSHGKVCYVIEELKELKAIENKGLDGRRGKAIRVINPNFLFADQPPEFNEPPESDSKESNVGVKESNVHAKESNVRVKESNPVDCRRGEERGEREEGGSPVSSNGQDQVTADEVITEAMLANPVAGFSDKAKRGIEQALAETKPAREEVLPWVRDRVSQMDSFTLQNAGSKLAAELPGAIAASRKARQTEQQQAEHLRRIEEFLAAESKRRRQEFLETVKRLAEEEAIDRAINPDELFGATP